LGTPTKLLRLAYVCEFLLALVAIFAAWSEIGGQSSLDLMHWGWKLGLSVSLAGAIVAYTAALLSEQRVWSLRSARWLTVIIILLLAIGIVTYYYALQVDNGDTDENSGNASFSGLNSASYVS
jgi:glucan phosphoethanolaminetransferase (alkaline phosphatase superfamily)